MTVKAALETKQMVYFCVQCHQFLGWCDCCEPPGCSLGMEEYAQLTLAFSEAFEGTQWDNVPWCYMPERIIKEMANRARKKVMPHAELSFEPPRCSGCEERAMNGGQHDS